MTSAEQKAYAKGYGAGVWNKWPLHKPPMPPNEIAKELIGALEELRNEIDATLATFGPDDEVNKKLSPSIDRATNALESLSKWIRDYAPGVL